MMVTNISISTVIGKAATHTVVTKPETLELSFIHKSLKNVIRLVMTEKLIFSDYMALTI